MRRLPHLSPKRRPPLAGFCLALAILLFTGCSSLFGVRKESATDKTADALRADLAGKFTRDIQSQPQPMVVIGKDALGKDQISIMPPPPAKETITGQYQSSQVAKSSESQYWSLKTSIPWAVSALMFAVALVIGVVAWFFFSKSTAVGKAADAGLGQSIDLVSTLAKSATDSAEIARLNAVQANLEKQRGKVAGS